MASNIVSFEDAVRGRGAGRPLVITEAELRAAQKTVDLRDCHVAFDRCSVEVKTNTRRFTLFNDLSATFPRGRRMVILGHKGSGKTTIVEMMMRKRQTVGGRILVNSRLSWPVGSTSYFDSKLTLRQNLVFLGRVLGVDPGKLFRASCDICGFNERQLREKMRAIPTPMRRRIGVLVVLAADFDCHLLDGPPKSAQYGLTNVDLGAVAAALLDRDYVMTLTDARQVPEGCDLAYLLYDGRLYMFDDVATAVKVYEELPVPEVPDITPTPDDDEDEDDSVEEVF
ncbi:ATP-binding cassette domain-containing protein [Acuticoccus sp.]|uniref:ATP-binding cassette domain-containing protein n=1 Tax=Acuticoccus sp. TaxID=1904378 RepID=UPI003B51865E